MNYGESDVEELENSDNNLNEAESELNYSDNVSNISTDDAGDEQDDEGEEIEDLDLLLNTVTDEDSSVHRAVEKTFDIRRESIMNGESKYIFELFYAFPKYIEYDFELLFLEHGRGETFLDLKEQMFSTINIIFASQFGRKKDFVTTLLPELQSYGKMLVLLYNATKQSLFLKIDALIKIVDENMSVADTIRFSNSSNKPFVIMRDGDLTEFMIAIDGRLIPLQSEATVDDAVVFLFKIFHLWNIEYTPEFAKLFTLIDAISYKIDSLIRVRVLEKIRLR